MGIPGFIASIGFRAIAGNIAGKAVSGVKDAGAWLRSLDLVHFLLLAAVLFGAWQTAGRWIQHRHTAKVETQLKGAVKALSDTRTSLATSQANETALKQAIGDQNKAIADLSSKSAAQQANAQKAVQAATGRAQEAEATSARLKASARAGGPNAGDCEPSEALKEQWQ